jgi:hypothetical protein
VSSDSSSEPNGRAGAGPWHFSDTVMGGAEGNQLHGGGHSPSVQNY